jgi:hypothetical protein
MESKYSDMHALLKGDSQAWKYYNMLPDHVRDHIGSQADTVNTFSSLRAQAEHLLHGD